MKHLLVALFLLTALYATAQHSPVKVAGAMREVMWQGKLEGAINLDTINNKQHLNGLGPLAFLKGEILVIDGKSYLSTVAPDGSMHVSESFKTKAAFFVYSHVQDWKNVNVPEDIITMQQLENYLEKMANGNEQPFPFKIVAKATSAQIHLVNLPDGSKVSNPQQAHEGLINYTLQNEAVEIIGFFSRHHQSVFTHHDTFMHMHLVSADKKSMGHVDDISFEPGSIRLYLPNKPPGKK